MAKERNEQNEKELLANYLKELHLPTVRASYEELARQAQQEASSYERYLLELVQREVQERRSHRIERLLRQSQVPLDKSWPALDLKRLPPKVLQQARGTLAQAESRVLSARAALAGDPDIPTDRHPAVMEALATLRGAELDLANTPVRAPGDGVVSQTARLQHGQYVTPAVPVWSL